MLLILLSAILIILTTSETNNLLSACLNHNSITGISLWDSCSYVTHVGFNFDYSLAQFMLQVFKPQSTLELGCGYGLYSDWMSRYGGVSKAYCIEPGGSNSIIFSNNNTDNKPQLIPLHILDGSDDSSACIDSLESFDLVFSVGVADHLPPEIHSRLVDFLVKKVKGFLVFSAAGPSQGRVSSETEAYQHKTRDEWQEEFESRGMLFLKKTTADLQATCYNKSHRRGNIMVFAGLHAPMGHALDSELTVNIDIDMSFYDFAVQKSKTGVGTTVYPKGESVLWCSNLKFGELRTWPDLVIQQSSCFKDICY